METRGVRNNNPLNLRHGSKWLGLRQQQTDKSFCQFTSMNFGIRAAIKLLRNYITGFNGTRQKSSTPDAIITRFAPPSENATRAYIDYVVKKSQIGRYEVIGKNDKEKIYRLVEAMALYESRYALSYEQFCTAWSLL